MARTSLAFLLCLGLLSVTAAQTRPDFSGTWVMDEKRSGSSTHEAFVGPVEWQIQQSPGGVLLQRKRGETVAPYAYTWVTERNESRPSGVVAPTADGPGHRSFWDGERLVLETHQDVQGKTVTTKEALMLSADGRELIVERVLEVEHGYTLKGAKNFSAVKDIFVRAER